MVWRRKENRKIKCPNCGRTSFKRHEAKSGTWEIEIETCGSEKGVYNSYFDNLIDGYEEDNGYIYVCKSCKYMFNEDELVNLGQP